MKNATEQELLEVVYGFLDRTLDKSRWTHEAHIITAIWHLREFDAEDALCRLRSGIISYNLAVGGQNTGQNGYHETMTIFWWDIINQFVKQHRERSFKEMSDVFLASPMADKAFPFRFYSKEKILSPVARSKYVEPDLEEIKIETLI